MAKLTLLLSVVIATANLAACTAQTVSLTAGDPIGHPQMAGGCAEPSSANAGKMGCYFDGAIMLTYSQGPLFYHIDEFVSREQADKSRTDDGVVINAYGRWFLETVNNQRNWRPVGGRHLTTIGPLPRPRGHRIIARFMQAMTRPGATTQPHSHYGPEAFHVLTGAICMESSDGATTTVGPADYWIVGGKPMQLSTVGSGVRRSTFVVLHPSDQPWMIVDIPWKPKGICGRTEGSGSADHR